MKSKSPSLYVVATPIGNLGDMTFRAVETLKMVDLIACEDTRQSRKLLQHFAISTPTCSYHDHSTEQKRHALLERLEKGESVALISDAGTPLISDPGYKLVVEMRKAGYEVIPIPGACSPIAALSVAGLPTDQFYFAGFLPSKTSERQKMIRELSHLSATLCLFESAKRLSERLNELSTIMGADRHAVVAREITKLHEEFRSGSLTELAAHYASAATPKGEVVLLIGAAKEKVMDEQDVDMLLRKALAQMSVKQAAADVAEITGLGRSELYQRALVLKQQND